MKKLFKFSKSDIPLYFTSIVFIVVLGLWFFPGSLGIISDKYPINDFRSNLKDLASLFYIVITLWLVLVTRKMAEISLKAQKSINRPELMCELFLSDEKPSENHFTGIKNVEIRNTSDGNYSENLAGASLFLVIKNRYGGGKSINLQAQVKLEVRNPERIVLDRNISVDYLAEGDSIAFYLYRFERPSIEHCQLTLNDCKLQFTTPFGEASKDACMTLIYNNKNKILVTGNHKGAIKLDKGIRENI